MGINRTHLSVSRATHERLFAYIRHLVSRSEAGHDDGVIVDYEPINPECCGLSADAAINRLLDEVYRHRRRSAEQNARRKKRPSPAIENETGEGL